MLERICALGEDKQAALLAKVFEGDCRTPSCPACGVKPVARNGKSEAFWGCANYLYVADGADGLRVIGQALE